MPGDDLLYPIGADLSLGVEEDCGPAPGGSAHRQLQQQLGLS